MPNKIVYVSDNADWVVKRIGRYITMGLGRYKMFSEFNNHFKPCASYRNCLIHFGSVHTFSKSNYQQIHPSNRVIVTVYHGYRGLNPDMDETIERLVNYQTKLSGIVVSNSIMKERVISWGILPEKVTYIPLGIDLGLFRPDSSRREKIRKKLKIPKDTVCIGSFEKDGEGWQEGLVPKLIKGPDIFIKVLKELAKKHKLYCLLSGPARGYVKKGLQEAGIPYTHRFFKRYADIVDFYNCLDLYIVTARDQGGPESILESMATGVPLVATRTGIAPDIITDGKNALLADVGDVKGIAEGADTLLNDRELRARIVREGLERIKGYDWSIIIREFEGLYKKSINGA